MILATTNRLLARGPDCLSNPVSVHLSVSDFSKALECPLERHVDVLISVSPLTGAGQQRCSFKVLSCLKVFPGGGLQLFREICCGRGAPGCLIVQQPTGIEVWFKTGRPASLCSVPVCSCGKPWGTHKVGSVLFLNLGLSGNLGKAQLVLGKMFPDRHAKHLYVGRLLHMLWTVKGGTSCG